MQGWGVEGMYGLSPDSINCQTPHSLAYYSSIKIYIFNAIVITKCVQPLYK